MCTVYLLRELQRYFGGVHCFICTPQKHRSSHCSACVKENALAQWLHIFQARRDAFCGQTWQRAQTYCQVNTLTFQARLHKTSHTMDSGGEQTVSMWMFRWCIVNTRGCTNEYIQDKIQYNSPATDDTCSIFAETVREVLIELCLRALTPHNRNTIVHQMGKMLFEKIVTKQ